MSPGPDLAFTEGELLGPVEVGPIAHGGHCVARHEGRVIFVRHAIPGETVRVRIRQVASSFARADAVEVLRASPHRVTPPCSNAARCGGCDFQHIEVGHQRELKRRVVSELLDRLAGYRFTGEVEAVDPPDLGWRTRMRYQVSADGQLGLRAHRSAEVVALPASGCLVARPEISGASEREGGRDVSAGSGRTPGGELVAVAAASGVLFAAADNSGATVVEQAAGREFRVAAGGFWQSHRAAPSALASAIVDGLGPRPGEVAFDLYCGVGLFAGVLADAGCRVWGVEGSRSAAGLARSNVPQARFLAGDVAQTMRRLPRRADLVVLDPPRAGAGPAVIEAVVRLRPRRVCYVACDPATLGRDLGFAQKAGLAVVGVRALDLFPMTHHIECVATLESR